MLPMSSPTQNHLLAALSDAEFQRLEPHLKPVALRLGDILYQPDERQTTAYFPTTAVVSLHYVMASGSSAEIMAVGNDGVVGIALFMGGDSTPSLATVTIAGQGYQLDSSILKQEFMRGELLQKALLFYTQALMTQVAQTGACNRHHSISQQLSGWLLTALDRMTTRELVVTHELIANMLGVRREGVSGAAGDLQRAGLISYRRGHISVLDRSGLETQACECYAVVKKEILRLQSARVKKLAS